MFIRKNRICLFMCAFLISGILFAEGEVGLSVKRSFSQSAYTPGEATTVTVTLDIDYIGTNKEYPQNVNDNTEGFFIQVNYEEYIASDCAVLWGKTNFIPGDFKEKERQEENNKILVTYDYHYEDDETGELVCRNFPLQYSYKVTIPETATGHLVWGSESNVILGYYLPADEGGTAMRVVTASYPIGGANAIMADNMPLEDKFTVYYYSNNGKEEEPYKITELAPGEYTTLTFGETGLSSKDNYSFVNWNTKSDGKGEAYAENVNFAITNSDVSFYAQWEENKIEEYEITYFGNGGITDDGNTNYKSQKILQGTEYLLDANRFVNKYFSFAGWKDENKNNVANTIIVNENINLYAQWIRNQVTITYQPGAEATFEAPLKVQADAGSVYTVTTVKPQKDNSIFVGWSWNNKMVGDTIDIDENDITLVANWKQEDGQAIIVYHTGVGIPEDYFTVFSPKSKTVEYDAGDIAINGSAYFFPFGGMAIKGWAKEEIFNAPIVYQEGETVTLEAGETLHLYAIWEYYPDLTLAGIVRPDFNFNNEIGEESAIFDKEEECLNVSNSMNTLGTGKVHANENAYLWFRMINYGFIDSGSFKVIVKLTKDNDESVVLSRGTVLRREFYEEDLFYRTITEDYNNGYIANGLHSDGNRWEHVLVCLDMGKLAVGDYTVQVSLDTDKTVEEVIGTDNEGVQGGGETDNEFTMKFTVNVYNEYDVEYHENADWFNGWNRTFSYKDQTKLLSPEEVFDSRVVDVYFSGGFYFAEWNTRADGGGEHYEVGATVTSNLQLYAIWKQKSQLFFNPLNQKESVHNWRYISLSNSDDSVEPADAIYANEDFFVNISIINWSASDSGPYEVGVKLYSVLDLDEPISYKEVSYVSLSTAMYVPPHKCCQWSLPAGQYRLVCIVDVNDKVLEYYEIPVKENLYQIEDENGENIWVNGYKIVTLDFTVSERAYNLIVDGGTGDGDYIPGTKVEIQAMPAEEGKVFDHWEAEAGVFADAKAYSTVFTMPAQAVTVTAIYIDANERQYDEWPEDKELYAPKDYMNFREKGDLSIMFSWPKIRGAAKYLLSVSSYDGTKTFSTTTKNNTFTLEGLDEDSYVWNVTALNEDETVHDAETSSDFHYGVISTPLVIIDGLADGNSIRLAYDTMVEGYSDGAYAYQIFFFSLNTRTWTVLEKTLQVVDGQTVIDLGVNASNGYLYICPVTRPESKFIEMYIE